MLFAFLLLCFPDLTLGDLGFHRDFLHVIPPHLNHLRQEGIATLKCVLLAGTTCRSGSFLCTMVGLGSSLMSFPPSNRTDLGCFSYSSTMLEGNRPFRFFLMTLFRPRLTTTSRPSLPRSTSRPCCKSVSNPFQDGFQGLFSLVAALTRLGGDSCYQLAFVHG